MKYSSYPFKRPEEALAFYNFKNPARQRFVDLLEPSQKGSYDYGVHFSGLHPHDIWAQVCLAIDAIVKDLDFNTSAVFRLYWIAERDKALGKEEIAKKLHCTRRHVNRLLVRAMEEFEKECLRRGLIEPPPSS